MWNPDGFARSLMAETVLSFDANQLFIASKFECGGTFFSCVVSIEELLVPRFYTWIIDKLKQVFFKVNGLFIPRNKHDPPVQLRS